MIRNERHALIVVGTSYKLAPAGDISRKRKLLGKEKNYYLTLSIDGKIIDAKKNTPLKLKGFQVNKPSLGISPVLVGTPDRDFSLKSEEERTIEYTIELFDHKNNPIAKLKDTDDIYYRSCLNFFL